MPETAAGINSNESLSRRTPPPGTSPSVHPAWMRLMRYCAELGHGEIEKLKIQDGVPVIADVVRQKVKFT